MDALIKSHYYLQRRDYYLKQERLRYIKKKLKAYNITLFVSTKDAEGTPTIF